MVASSLRILVLECDTQRAERLSELFLQEEAEASLGLEFEVAESLAEGRRKFDESSWSAVVTRLGLPDAKGLEALVDFHVSKAESPVIVILDDEEPQAVLDAAQSLADDCLFWNDLDRSSLLNAVRYAIDRRDMMSDLRERQARSHAAAARNPFKALLDQIDEAVFLIARDNRQLLYANEVARVWFSGSLDQMKETLEEYRVLEDETLELEVSTPNPGVPVAELRSTWLEWKGVPACMATLRNISKRKRAEEAFLASQRRLELALKASNIGLWSWVMQARNPVFSERWKAQLGYTSFTFPDTISAFREHLHPEDRERAFRLFRRFIRKPWPEFECEYRMRDCNGSYRHILCRAEMVTDKDGNGARLIGSHIDITERRQEEEARALIDERLDSSRHKERIESVLGSWADSAGKSVAACRGAMDSLAAAMASENFSPSIREKFDAAKQELAGLEKSLPAPKSEGCMEPSSIDLGDLVLKVARDTDMKLPQDCSFEIELGRSVPSVEIDVRIVSELLSELLSRSCESLVERSDARLTIRTGYRELNLTDLSLMANGEGRKSGGYAYLEIEDNGTRFSLKAFKDALGDCNDSTLSGALRLAFEAGAAIDLASRAGERTSLRIYFSADEGSPEATASPDARKVLVVEDEIALHPMIEAVVKSLELVPDLQVDGCAAWDRLRANPDDFRLAILDVNLPGFGGDRLYELMIENCPSPLPTVFVSGDEEDAKIAGQDCGGPVRCLSKPYGMAKLKEAIVELLNPRELLEA